MGPRVAARDAVDGRQVIGVEAVLHPEPEGEQAQRGPGGGQVVHAVRFREGSAAGGVGRQNVARIPTAVQARAGAVP